jgi:ribosomal protein S27E
MDHLDGNVLAGPGTGLFAFDPTTTQCQCQSCADIATLGQAMVYGQPMGFVARCRYCGNVLVVIVEHAGQKSLNMRGLRWLRVTDQASDDRISAEA